MITNWMGRGAGYAWVAMCLLAALPLGLRADTLRGRVVDPQNRPVANARVQLSDRASGEVWSTLTDRAGAYVFASIPAGGYLLSADAANSALAGSVDAVVDGETDLELSLSLSSVEAEVVVTASSTPVPVQEVAKALDVVDGEQIALRDEYSLGEAVRQVPGVRVRQLRGPGSMTSIQARGLRTQDTALLFDGLRVRDAAAPQGDAGGLLESLTLVDSGRVEVMRGSGSSLYGSHAMAGVVNVTTRQGGGRPHGELLAEGGGLGFARGVARAGGGLAENRFVYSGGIGHVNVSDGVRGGSPYRNTTGQAFGRYSFTENITLSGRVWATDTFTNLNESPAFPQSVTANFPAAGPVEARGLDDDNLRLFEQGQGFNAGSATFVPDQIDPDNHRTGALLSASFTLRHQVNPNSSYQVTYHGLDSNRGFRDGPGGPGAFDPAVSNENRFDGHTDTVYARTDHRIGAKHLASLGWEFEREEYVNRNTDESASPLESSIDIEQRSQAVFAQDQMRLMQGRLQIALSGRVQWFDLQTPQFSGTQTPYDTGALNSPKTALTGDAAVAYFFVESQTKVRAHVGNSYRAPSAFERFGGSFSSFSGGFNFWGDPRLAPERSVAFDAGVDQWFAEEKLRLSGTVYYTNLQETILFDFANFPGATDPFGRFGGYVNSSGGIARGVELSGQYSPASGTTLQAAYTYTNSDSRTPRIGADYFAMPGVSDQMFTLTATQWVTKRLNVAFDLFAVSDYSLSPFGALGRRMVFDGPVKADVVFRYAIPVREGQTVELFGKVENLLDRRYFENGFLAPQAWAVGGLRFRF